MVASLRFNVQCSRLGGLKQLSNFKRIVDKGLAAIPFSLVFCRDRTSYCPLFPLVPAPTLIPAEAGIHSPLLSQNGGMSCLFLPSVKLRSFLHTQKRMKQEKRVTPVSFAPVCLPSTCLSAWTGGFAFHKTKNHI